MNRSEDLAAVIGVLRARLSDEPMPSHDTPTMNAFTDAMQRIRERADSADFVELGQAAYGLLVDNARASLGAERAALLAQLAATRGD